MKGATDMRKNNLKIGAVYSLIGAVLLAIGLLTGYRLSGLIFGFGFAMTLSGISMVCRYFYWNTEKNRERYAEKLAKEEIEIHDELKTKIRDRAGRYTYLLGLGAVSLSILVFGSLNQLEMAVSARVIVLYLGGYIFFQIFAFNIIYYQLLKKY